MIEDPRPRPRPMKYLGDLAQAVIGGMLILGGLWAAGALLGILAVGFRMVCAC